MKRKTREKERKEADFEKEYLKISPSWSDSIRLESAPRRPTFSPRIPIISISSLMIDTILILVPNTLLTTLVKSLSISLCIGTPSTPRQRSSRAARRRIIVDRDVKLGGLLCEGLRVGLVRLVGDVGFEVDGDGPDGDEEEEEDETWSCSCD